MARSAGAQAQLVSKEGGMAPLLKKLPSGEIRKVTLECAATIGQVGIVEHEKRQPGQSRTQTPDAQDAAQSVASA